MLLLFFVSKYTLKTTLTTSDYWCLNRKALLCIRINFESREISLIFCLL